MYNLKESIQSQRICSYGFGNGSVVELPKEIDGWSNDETKAFSLWLESLGFKRRVTQNSTTYRMPSNQVASVIKEFSRKIPNKVTADVGPNCPFSSYVIYTWLPFQE
jgi:hypothetical protein